MRLGLAEILEKVDGLQSRAEKIDMLRKFDTIPLRRILEFAFDKRIKWRLPEGRPPYRPCDFLDQEGMLYTEMKKMYLFMDNPGAPNLTPSKREGIFIQILESIAPKDAALLISAKEHEMPYLSVTEDIVREAFPDLLKFEYIPPARPPVIAELKPAATEETKAPTPEVANEPVKKSKIKTKKKGIDVPNG